MDLWEDGQKDETWMDGDAPLEPLDGEVPLGPGAVSGEGPRRRQRRAGYAAAFVLGTLVCAGVSFFLHSSPAGAGAAGASAANSGAQAGSVRAPQGGEASEAANGIVIDIQGDVHHPGVYTLAPNARVKDAVQAAGGYLHAADAQNVNEAAPLNDGTEVVIPASGSAAPSPAAPPAGAGGEGSGGASTASSALAAPAGGSSGAGASAPGPGTQQIDLNTADLATLETLPDIGPTRAAAILAYRTAHGPFPSVQAVQDVHGIGPTIYSHIAPYLYVGRAQSSSTTYNG
ncbi:helix-hairpin-helix domain-containing protein [Alicyclobacillus cycloheptanicus]|uniref:Competence protein ComEA n=1 Tax=Alicyclobacillus cycloheptanicus TaxID=1457 RepID=A0ABT9XJN4_9BACL|nr:helix-hairpin-helix domain-containing protein [Alicyclobacillus cycloheptanicus]MDQ0190500.1 competence protein ComEA [Alicyclobacillus cycloheptanicus]WDM00738.1 helix-hairpin-helix domain-containing protein [Alicyclobacillus cycloheptanicus]